MITFTTHHLALKVAMHEKDGFDNEAALCFETVKWEVGRQLSTTIS